MWFEELTGFREESPDNVKSKLVIEGDAFISRVNNRKFIFGELEIPTLEKLKQNSPKIEDYDDNIRASEIVADVKALHGKAENANALFQAASQFNLLEMVSPNVIPEQGIEDYEFDLTQGPACAIACGAGTIYRNYFVNLNGQIGQTADNQIDCLDLIGKELGNEQMWLWTMQNGYALVNQYGLSEIDQQLSELNEDEREHLKELLRTGIQWNTEVTLSESRHKVSQIYCAALPVAYGTGKPGDWESFARIILEATYESTLYAAVINMENNNSNLVYLTLVGGGVFGNSETWILESMQKAVRKFRNVPLDVKVVSHRKSNRNLVKCLNDI